MVSLVDRVTESEKPAMTDVTCAVGVNVPADVRALCSLPSIDYIDLFTRTPVPQTTPETWAKAVMERAAGGGGQLLWRRVLGLRLARKPGNIAGWTSVSPALLRADGRGQDSTDRYRPGLRDPDQPW